MGDVRGHGLAATVAAVLGSFREAVHDEPDLGRVLRRLERALARHLRERARGEHPSAGGEPDHPVAEEFVTVLLLEIRPDGEAHVLNCGHPWPYLLGPARAEPLSGPNRCLPSGRSRCPPNRRPSAAAACCPARRCSCTPTVSRTPGTDGVGSFRCRPCSPRPPAPGPSARSRCCAPSSPHSCGTSEADRPTASRCSSCTTTAGTSYDNLPVSRSDTGRTASRDVEAANRHAPPRCARRSRVVSAGSVIARGPARRPPATECRAGSGVDGAEAGRRTVRGGAGGPAGLLRGISVNRLETLRDSARTLRILVLRSHPV